MNRAERRGDYWTFGGIIRPVWLEARPKHHITWTAIDARADGTFRAQLHFDEPLPRNTRVTAQILDAKGQPVGAPMSVLGSRKAQLTLEGALENPTLWTAETPHLYHVKFLAQQGFRTLLERVDRFGFRTIEVRPNDGVYLNGRKIILKGVNRHSFRPDTGRTLTREQNYEDARLIKAANMNAVRMSHYPPDPAFLEAADEIGLYVLDELAGWQGAYDTPAGARLVGQMIRRDVNHPSILFWDNGNEGGWNTGIDGEFARWDPQARPVLHPWAVHSGIDTNHYERYDSTVKLSRGPTIFMPTEFLHGLYDGGFGAGLEDYWQVMSGSPTVAGGFFWAYADECVERTDRDRKLDCMGNQAPDGMLGPYLQPEAGYYAVQQVWSPVQIDAMALGEDGALRFTLRNEYDFTDLATHEFDWMVLRHQDLGHPDPGHQGPGAGSGTPIIDQGKVRGPALAPRQQREWAIPGVGAKLAPGDVVRLTVTDATRRQVRAFTLATPAPTLTQAQPATSTPAARISREGNTLRANDFQLTFGEDGALQRLRHKDVEIPLDGPRLMAWIRDERRFKPAGEVGTLRRLTLAPRRERDVIARAEYSDSALRSLTWRIAGDELRLAWEIAYTGDVDILGIRFGFPETKVNGKRWHGEGPFRIWKNRLVGNTFGTWNVSYSNSVPGETFAVPEFPGFFGEWRWLEMLAQSPDVRVVFRNVSGVPWFGLHRPEPGVLPVIELPDLGWSFLHVIPPIGNKFDPPETLGPQSHVTRVDGVLRGEIAIRLAPRH